MRIFNKLIERDFVVSLVSRVKVSHKVAMQLWGNPDLSS